MKKKVIFSAIQPTGNLHIGNYLGAIKNWVDLQNSGEYECYFSIADYHSLTGNMSAKDRHDQITRTAAELIAAGIDPEKSTFYVQSHVPQHTELAWIFNSVTPMGELKRMTQFKDKSGISGKKDLIQKEYEKYLENAAEEIIKTYAGKIVDEPKVFAQKLYPLIDSYSKFNDKLLEIENKQNAGLFTYPILQAADILLYHGTHVPVGQDQIQHVELTRDVARWFNKKFGDYFPETKHLLTPVPKVMSLLEPNKKMSKSLGEGHVIELADEPEVINKKLKKAVTASEGGEGAPGVENLFTLLENFGDKSKLAEYKKAESDGSIRYGDLKADVAEAVASNFADFREKRKELLNDHNAIAEILIAGAKKAGPVAQKTMEDVRKMVGVR